MPAARLLGAALAVALAPALAGCDGAAAPAEPGANSFTIRVDGAEPETRRGAFFGTYVSAATGNETFAVLLGTDPVATVRGLDAPAVGLVRDGGAPGPGAHALRSVNPAADPPADAFTGFYVDPDAFVAGETPPRSGLYFTGSGTVTLEAATADGVRGTFAMEAMEYAGEAGTGASPSGVGVRVEGTFHAVPSDGFGAEGALLGRRPAWLRWLPLVG